MKLKTNIKAGQEASAATPTDYAQSIVNGLTNTIQGETKNLRLWSLVGIQGNGFSNWMIVRQKPPSDTQ